VSKPTKIELANIGGGGLAAQVNRELANICENIADPNVKADSVRKLSIAIKIKPDKKRQTAAMSYSVRSQVPGADAGETTAWIAMEAGEIGLFSVDTKQNEFPFQPSTAEPTVTEIKPISASQTAKAADPAPPAAYAPPLSN
jgi:hypothetical protein